MQSVKDWSLQKDHMFYNIEIETDALQLKILLESVDEYSHHELGPVLLEVTQFLQQSWMVTMPHIPRDTNHVAHQLAQLALSMDVSS